MVNFKVLWDSSLEKNTDIAAIAREVRGIFRTFL
jgi:hypothetical protein